jgi:hypothetical protein
MCELESGTLCVLHAVKNDRLITQVIHDIAQFIHNMTSTIYIAQPNAGTILSEFKERGLGHLMPGCPSDVAIVGIRYDRLSCSGHRLIEHSVGRYNHPFGMMSANMHFKLE